MKAKAIKIMMAALLIVAALMPFLADSGSGTEEVWAPPPIAEGDVTSDATWNGNFWTENIVIKSRVTVQVSAGSNWWVPDTSFIYVEGTLIVRGTEANPVEISEFLIGFGWDGIQVNGTGKVIFENFTIEDLDSGGIGLLLAGMPSIIKNGVIIGGNVGIKTITSAGGHIIESVDLIGQTAGMHLQDNVNEMIISDLSIMNVALGSFAAVNCQNVTLKDAYTEGGSMFAYGAGGQPGTPAKNIKFIDCILSNRSATGPAYGFWFDDYADNIEVIGGAVNNCNLGIYMSTIGSGNFRFEHFMTSSNVDVALYSTAASGFSASFIDCRLLSSLYNVELTGGSFPQRVELINSSYTQSSDFDLIGDCIVNISHYVNVEVLDGNGDPADVDLEIDQLGLGTVYDDRLPNGWLDKYPLKSIFIDETIMNKVIHDFKAVSNLPSGSEVGMEMVWITEYDTINLFMDLAPYNNFPTEIEFEEDGKIDFDLYDNFTDPEGEDLTWDITTGPDLNYKMIQGQKVLRLETVEDNWFGTSWVYINATDADGNWTDVNATVTVTPVNDPPVLLEDLPELTTPEDTPAWINFSGRAEDIEEDALIWSAENIDNCTLSWDESGLNLTVTPDENWFGILQIPVKVSDGTVNPEWILTVNVTPVNDMPLVKVLWSNGTEADQVEYVWNETTNITVWEITTLEDVPVEFGYLYNDVETIEPASILAFSDLLHGALDLTVYQREEIINATTNETAMVDYTIVTNYTYTPKGNDFAGDLIQFNISDGEEEVTLWIWFNVESVNDRPEFEAPDEWNTTVEMDNKTVIDIGEWMTDVDGDVLTISVDPDEYITLNGTQLEIHYNDTFEGDHQNVTVTISDGTLTAGAVLLINITREEEPGPGPDDDDDDDEFGVTNPEVKSTEDGWTITVEGEEGQDVYLAVVDENGTVTYHEMEYVDGKYEATLDKEDAEEGFDYYFTDEDGGDPIIEGGSLPDIEEEKDEPFPWWIVAVVLAILLIGIVILLILGKGAGSPDLDEE